MVNVLWYHFDDIVTYSSKMPDTELGAFFFRREEIVHSKVRYDTVLGASRCSPIQGTERKSSFSCHEDRVFARLVTRSHSDNLHRAKV